MSSAFEYRSAIFWTSNGMVKHFLEECAKLGARRHGAEHPVVRWLEEQSDAFYLGAVIFIDNGISDPAELAILGELLESVANDGIKKGDEFGPPGIAWIDEELRPLVRWLREGGPPIYPKGSRRPEDRPTPSLPATAAPAEPPVAFPAGPSRADPGRRRLILFLYGAGSFALAAYILGNSTVPAAGNMVGKLFVLVGTAAIIKALWP